MNNPIKARLTAAAIAMALGTVSTQASAIAFFFDNRGGFDHDGSFAFDPTGVPPGAPDPDPDVLFSSVASDPKGAGYPAGTHGQVNWFRNTVPADQSSIAITTFSDAGTGDADGGTSTSSGVAGNGDAFWDVGEWWAISQLDQSDAPILTGGEPLWNMDAISNLEIWDNAGHTGTALVSDLNNVVPIQFSEAAGVPDFYTAPISSFDPLPTFIHMNMEFQVNFRITEVSNVDVDLGIINPGFITITTDDNETSTVLIEAQVEKIRNLPDPDPDPDPVPEPDSLALIGLGLMLTGGLAARRRKRVPPSS